MESHLEAIGTMKVRSVDVQGALSAWVCGLLFLLYAATAMPGLGWRDAPEFAAATHTLGIAHPAGFPTFSLLTKVFTFFPLGSIPFRITLAESFFQVLTLYLVFRIIIVLVNQSEGESDSYERTNYLAAGLTAIGLGLTPVMWSNATGIEVYGLNLLFISLILACAVKWIQTARDHWLYIGGLVYGFSAGNHATVSFFLPGLLLLVLIHARQHRLRHLVYLSFYFLVGFSVYLYLPIRANAGAGFDFGFPIDWERFFSHITDRKDAGTHFDAAQAGTLWYYLSHFVRKTVPTAFWFTGLPLVIIGVLGIWRRYWALVLAAALMAFVNVVFFIKWTDSVAFLPTWLIIFLFVGAGLAALFHKLPLGILGSSRFWLWMGGVFAIVLICVIAVQYPDRNRSQAFLSTEAFRGDFESLPPEAISITAIFYFHQSAYQDIFRLRPDVTVMGLSDFTNPRAFHPITPDRFPLVRVPKGEYNFDTGVSYLGKFIAVNLDDKRDIYWLSNDLDSIFHLHLKPALDMLFRFSPNKINNLSDSESRELVDRLISRLYSQIQDDGFLTDSGLQAYYFDLFINVSKYLGFKGQFKDGLALLKMFEDLLGPAGADCLSIKEQSALDNSIGAFLFQMGYLQEAEKRFRQAITKVPLKHDYWALLGRLLLKTNRMDEALKVLNRAVELDPARPEALFYLGEYYRIMGQKQKAEEYYRQSLALAKDPMFKDIIQKAHQKNFGSAMDGR